MKCAASYNFGDCTVACVLDGSHTDEHKYIQVINDNKIKIISWRQPGKKSVEYFLKEKCVSKLETEIEKTEETYDCGAYGKMTRKGYQEFLWNQIKGTGSRDCLWGCPHCT